MARHDRETMVVVGGGIAGVCCAEELCRLRPGAQITLISASSSLKGVETVSHVTRNVEELKVVVRPLSSLHGHWNNLSVLCATVVKFDVQKRLLALSDGRAVHYDKLCIATGARPKALLEHPLVLCIRDTDSVQELSCRLLGAKRVMVIGNGGIAMEAVHALKGLVDVVWLVKHQQIGDAFFDIDAASFLLEELKGTCQSEESPSTPADTARLSPRTEVARRQGLPGHAAGPRWMEALPRPSVGPGESGRAGVVVEYSEVLALEGGKGRDGLEGVTVILASGKVHEVDLVISAVGVEPNTEGLSESLELADDGGLLVDSFMETSCIGVFAAGDVCTVRRAPCASRQWFQMRLWTQARVMGAYTAHCMAGAVDELTSGFNFDLFTHCTRFFGMKIVLLGLYNGQTLEDEPEEDVVTYQRTMVKGGCRTFARVLLLRGRMQGAVLIGETELEETCENLILTGLDLSGIGAQLLDPDIELDHIFD